MIATFLSVHVIFCFTFLCPRIGERKRSFILPVLFSCGDACKLCVLVTFIINRFSWRDHYRSITTAVHRAFHNYLFILRSVYPTIPGGSMCLNAWCAGFPQQTRRAGKGRKTRKHRQVKYAQASKKSKTGLMLGVFAPDSFLARSLVTLATCSSLVRVLERWAWL